MSAVLKIMVMVPVLESYLALLKTRLQMSAHYRRNTDLISSLPHKYQFSVKMPLISPHIAALMSQLQAADNGSKSFAGNQAKAKTTEASSMLSLFHLLDRDSNGEVRPKHSNLF